MSSIDNSSNSNKEEKKIIYVDAACVNGAYRVGLYDLSRDKHHTFDLCDNIPNSFIAEKFALLYGLLYIGKRGSGGSCRYILLNDNEGATKDTALNAIGRRINVKVSWIPREINLADHHSRGKPNKGKKTLNGLLFFQSIVLPNIFSSSSDKRSKEENKKVSKVEDEENTTISFPSRLTEAVYKDIIENGGNMFPMNYQKFGVYVNHIKKTILEEKYPNLKINTKTKKVRMALVSKKILTSEGNSLYFIAKK